MYYMFGPNYPDLGFHRHLSHLLVILHCVEPGQQDISGTMATAFLMPICVVFADQQ